MARTDNATGTLLEQACATPPKRRWPTSVPWLTVWISWTPSDHDRITLMRQELETMAEEGKIVAERDRLEMERMLAQEVNVAERQHQLLLATTEYEAKAEAAKNSQPCVSRLRREQWAVITKRAEFEAENMRRRTELDKQQEALEAKLEHENRMDGLDRTMEFEDKEEELKFKREMRAMDRARRQSEFMQEQERRPSTTTRCSRAYLTPWTATIRVNLMRKPCCWWPSCSCRWPCPCRRTQQPRRQPDQALDHFKRRNGLLECQRPGIGSRT